LALIELGLKKLTKGKLLSFGKGKGTQNKARSTDVTDIVWNRSGKEWIEKGQLQHTIKLRNSFPSFYVSRDNMRVDEEQCIFTDAVFTNFRTQYDYDIKCMYRGQINKSNGKMHGRGQFITENGDIYEGYFKDSYL
jgi:hypothetical protein